MSGDSLLTLPGRQVVVKTGTSDSFADAWTVGFTPHLVTAVWGGNPDWLTKMTLNSDSYNIAAPMWHQFMQNALDAMGVGNEWYSEPPGLVHKSVKGQLGWYLPGTYRIRGGFSGHRSRLPADASCLRNLTSRRRRGVHDEPIPRGSWRRS